MAEQKGIKKNSILKILIITTFFVLLLMVFLIWQAQNTSCLNKLFIGSLRVTNILILILIISLAISLFSYIKMKAINSFKYLGIINIAVSLGLFFLLLGENSAACDDFTRVRFQSNARIVSNQLELYYDHNSKYPIVDSYGQLQSKLADFENLQANFSAIEKSLGTSNGSLKITYCSSNGSDYKLSFLMKSRNLLEMDRSQSYGHDTCTSNE